MKNSPEHKWIRKIRVGDVIKFGNKLRIVRAVTHSTKLRSSISFAIQRCSWTTRPYTVVTSQDLIYRAAKPTGKRIKLNKKIDKLIEQSLNVGGNASNCPVHCCDVEGVA